MAKKIKYTFQAILRPDGEFIDIEEKYYTREEIINLRNWSKICWDDKYRWVVVGGEIEQSKYIDEFFEL